MINFKWWNLDSICGFFKEYFNHHFFCLDVDECQEAGDVNGHHCHSNTRCVNVVGGYVCQCLLGYTRRDKFNCVEVSTHIHDRVKKSIIKFQFTVISV